MFYKNFRERFVDALALYQNPCSDQFSADATFVEYLALTPNRTGARATQRRKRSYRPRLHQPTPAFVLPLVIIFTAAAAFTAGWTLRIPADVHRESPLEPVTAEANIKRTYDVGSSPVLGIAYSPNGHWLAATTSDGAVVVKDAERGVELNKRFTPEATGAATGVVFAPDGNSLAVSTSSGSVLLWDVHGKSHPATLSPPVGRKSAVTGTTYRHDGKVLAVANSQGIVKLWDVSRPQEPVVLAAPGRLHSVTGIDFNPQGTTLAVGSIDGTVQLWDVIDPKRPEVLSTSDRGKSVTTVVYNPDGSALAVGSSDGTTQLWNVERPNAPRVVFTPSQRIIPADVGSITGLAFKDSRHLAASTAGGYVQLWDTVYPKRPRVLQPRTQTQAFTSLSYSRGRDTLAIGVTNGTVQVWETDTP
ncbi:WD40 repeat domain-containing protein [Streptomyces sp. NPDC002730]|uniref:WD40 repeat domain-containing protein n=1 Tax=Streptomyces sp. NPDC002730 TaxID=3364662 RepID=UPI00367F77B7